MEFETFRSRENHKTTCSKACDLVRRRRRAEPYFWSFVEKTEGCWFWRGNFFRLPNNSMGYGQYHVARFKEVSAHRVAFTYTNGPIAPGVLLRHTCGNGLGERGGCVRPDHMVPGTAEENVHDTIRMGRARNQHRPRLTDEQVGEIRGLSGIISRASIERRLGLSKGCIAGILTGRTYKLVA